MIRVLHIINGADLGGISSMILNYYNKIDKNKIHFDFVTHNNNLGVNGKKLQELGSKFIYIPSKRKNFPKYLKELNKVLKKNNYDVIHVHQNLSSYIDLFIALNNNIKVRIAHGHNADFRSDSLIKKIYRSYCHFMIKLFATKCIACSNDSLRYTFGKQTKKTIVLPNSIDIESYRYNLNNRQLVRKELKIKKNEIVLGCVGRMSTEKNHIFLIEMMNKLKEVNSNIKLVIVGNGTEYEKCKMLIKKYNMTSNVILTGARSDISSLMSSFDLFLLPSLNEGLGIVAIEAAASGLQIIMSDKVPKSLSFIPKSKHLILDTEKWCDEILNCDFKRINCITALNDNGYNINNSVKELEKIYVSELIKNEN